MGQRDECTALRKFEVRKFDDVFNIVGHMGVFQILTFLTVGMVALLNVELVYVNFLGYDMDHWCQVDALEGLPYSQQKYISVPKSDNNVGLQYSKCEMYDLDYSSFTREELRAWNRSKHILNDTKIIGCSHWVYDRSVFVRNFVSQWNLVCHRALLIDLPNILLGFGVLLSSLTSGLISDKFGRKRALLIYISVKILGNLMSVFLPFFEMMLFARFIIGLGNIGAYIIAFVILVEIVGPSHRTQVGIGFSILFSVGFCLVPAFAYFVRDHVRLQIIMAFPTILLLPIVWLVPESPRWLLLQGRRAEAEAILRKIAKINGREVIDGFTLRHIPMEKPLKNKANFTNLWRTPKMRLRTFILSFVWFSVSLVYFALSLNAGSLPGDIFLNTFLLGAVEIPANLLGMYLINVRLFGRRLAHCLALILGGVACLVCVPLLLQKSLDTVVTTMAIIGKGCATMAFNAAYVYTSELYPTEIRNLGLGACSVAARVSATLAPYMGGSMADLWTPLPSLVFGILGTVSGISVLFLPETYNKKLCDTIEEVEHDHRPPSQDSLDIRVEDENHMHITDFKYGSVTKEEAKR